jgi:hypothetical protein
MFLFLLAKIDVCSSRNSSPTSNLYCSRSIGKGEAQIVRGTRFCIIQNSSTLLRKSIKMS